MNLYGYANGDPVNHSDPFGLCPVPADDCPPGYWTAVGTAAGALLGGAGGGTGGFFAGAGVGAIPGAAVGAMKGAALGGAAGATIDGLIWASKGESAQIGQAITSVLGKKENTAENRRDVGDYCEECKANGVKGTKNSRGDFTFEELKTRVREFFGIDP
jgi:hypothetical protein